MDTLRQIAARAWDLRPTWWENAVAVVAGLAGMWWLDISWWKLSIAYAFVYAALFGVLGWLDLENEAAALTEAEDSLRDLGDGDGC